MPAAPSRGKLYLTLLAAFLGWMFDGMEMGIFPIIARPALEEMARGLEGAALDSFVNGWMAWATALFLWGAALGGIAFGWLGDKLGRVRAMSLSILCYSAFTGLSYFATEPWHLAASRFVAALGMGGEWALGVALVMELWPEKRRPMLAAVGLTLTLMQQQGDWWVTVVGDVPPATLRSFAKGLERQRK